MQMGNLLSRIFAGIKHNPVAVFGNADQLGRFQNSAGKSGDFVIGGVIDKIVIVGKHPFGND